jgi:hypothetical protein
MLNKFQLNLIKDLLDLCILEKESIFLVNQQLKQLIKLNLLLKQQNKEFKIFIVVDDVYIQRILKSFVFRAEEKGCVHVCTFSEHNKKLSASALNLYLLGSIHYSKTQQKGLTVRVGSTGVSCLDSHCYSLSLPLNTITNLMFFGTLIKKLLSNYA